MQALRNYEAPYCGNGAIEDGEECDCGTPLSCSALDQCCTPAGNDRRMSAYIIKHLVIHVNVNFCKLIIKFIFTNVYI